MYSVFVLYLVIRSLQFTLYLSRFFHDEEDDD